MSTGNQSDGPDLYFASGDNLPRDVQQQEDVWQGARDQVWEIPQGQTATYNLPTDGQGIPKIYNYGTLNIVMDGNGGQPIRGWAGDGGVDWQYEQWKKQKYADENFSYQSDQWDSNFTQMRPSDMRREALLADASAFERMQARQLEREFQRSSYNRQYGDRAYYGPGQYTGISYPGQDRDFGYYPDGPSLYNRDLPWYVNDCFGNGHRHGPNGEVRAVRNILRAIASLSDDNHHRSDGYWDRGHRRGMSHLDRLVAGNGWDSQFFSQGDYGPSYANWRGHRHGGNDFTNTALPIIGEVAMFAAAMDRRNDNEYRPYSGGDNYYHKNNQSLRMAQNREEALARRERQAERIRRNREDAMRREVV